MSINDKLDQLKTIKSNIKDAIIEKGVEVADTDSFNSYADKIKAIPTEGGDPYYEELYNLRTNNGTNMTGLFAYTKADTLDLSKLDTSKVTDMKNMFSNANINTLNVDGWDTSNVTNMSYMFDNCSSITSLDLSSFDTSKVTNMSEMFYGCNSLTSLDLSSFDTRQMRTTHVSNMFHNVPSTATITVSNDTWTLTEAETSFSGTFNRI